MSTYTTKVDHVEKKKEDSKKGKTSPKEQGKEQQETKQESEKQDDERIQWKKKLKCFICDDEHYASNCPQKKRSSQSQEHNKEEDNDAYEHTAWEADVFHTT